MSLNDGRTVKHQTGGGHKIATEETDHLLNNMVVDISFCSLLLVGDNKSTGIK